ncbi:MAG: NAD(P)/FAD-dependent oxidoreductase [Caldilineaceae bacterium]|nr:NAD(P)/FAD-dependent oxidoreductase [Caldilineaceae bacterium]
MREESFDVVVIGAGLGGLSAAGYLSKAGKRVLVLEHHTVPGGYAHEFRRGRYRFEVALHAIDGLAPGGWAADILEELGVTSAVRFNRLDPFYTVQFPEHTITAHANVFRYEQELIRHFPHEAEGVRKLIDAMQQVYWDVQRFSIDGEMKRRPPMAGIPAAYSHMISAMGQSWGEFMDAYIADPQLRGVFSTLWGYYGLPPSRLNASTFILPWVSYHLFGAYYPEGGSMAMSRALEQTILAHGGEIRYRQTVNRIEIRDGKAVAVETEQGLRITADAVVSNANPKDVMLKFVGKEHLPSEYGEKIAGDAPAVSNLVLYLGLDRDIRAEGWPYHELFVAEDYDIEGDYAAVMAGDFDRAGMVITNYTESDPGCAPDGGSVLVAMTLAPWDYADQWGTGGDLTSYGKRPQYLELKQDAADRLLTRLEERLPGLRASIKHMEVATPLTNYRYSLNPGGSIYGSEQTVENMYMGRLSEKTPVDNLFLTGAWIIGGGMSAALLSGRSVARRVEGYLDPASDGAGGLLPDEDAPPATAEAVETSNEQAEKPSRESAGAPAAAVSPAASRLPGGSLTAAGSKREFQRHALPGPMLFVCHGENNTGAVAVVSEHVRAQIPDPAELLIASCVDLRHVPRMFRAIAQRAMGQAYEKTAELIPADLDPADHVIILPDWDGAVAKSLGFTDVSKEAGVGLVAADGRILGAAQGLDGVDALLQALRNEG